MISVCMATFNGEKYLKEQINSIICQLGNKDELIISDDGSTDSTLNIIESFEDNRIKVIKHIKSEPNKGSIMWRKSKPFLHASKNFENALLQAKGNIIFLSDQDDIWYPGRVQSMLKALDFNDLVICNFSLIDSKGKILNENYYSKKPFKKGIIKNLPTMPFFGSAIAFKRDILNDALPLPNNCIAHDNWIGFTALKFNKRITYIETPLHGYRIHQTNVSHAISKKDNPLWYKLYYRIIFLLQLLAH